MKINIFVLKSHNELLLMLATNILVKNVETQHFSKKKHRILAKSLNLMKSWFLCFLCFRDFLLFFYSSLLIFSMVLTHESC